MFSPQHGAMPYPARMAQAALALCALLAVPTAQATLTYGATAFVETNTNIWGRPTVRHFRLDPEDGSMRFNPVDAAAGGALLTRTSDSYGNDLVAQANASARANSGTVSASVFTTQARGIWIHDTATSNATAGARMQLDTSVGGVLGTVGRAVVTGSFWASVNPGPFGGNALSSGANIGLNAFFQSFAPADGGCRNAGCVARDGINGIFTDGARLTSGNDRTWRLEIDVRAGDQLMLVLSADARAAAGYGASLTTVPPTPPSSTAAWIDGLGEAVPWMTPTTGMTGLWLSPGLHLADTSGLVDLGNGNYGFATPVPEPAAWMSLLGGLLLIAVGRARKLRRVPV
jgi:hypothetical protein